MNSAPPRPLTSDPHAQTKLKDISGQQWRSGIAAWLGWTFDGLDLHLFTLVATPMVAQLLGGLSTTHKDVIVRAAWIQFAFMMGWALGGSFFGVVADRIGRSRALCLTILTYSAFTGLSFFATAWWHLLLFRFVAALGIGGEWAVGASLLAETWPRRWRPWIAACLQSGVNIGILMAVLANVLLAKAPPHYLFLVGVLPALFVLWIRWAVPETEEWHSAKASVKEHAPTIADLFRGKIRYTTLWVMAVCAVSLTAHWAFMFWYIQHLRNLPDVIDLPIDAKNILASRALYLVIASSIAGCFFFGWIARWIGYRATIVGTFVVYAALMIGAYCIPRDHVSLMAWFPWIGFCQGVFGLFTMYLPPLFPTLVRTTGAGFCYNIGRIAAAVGTVIFGLYAPVGDQRIALLITGLLFLPAAACAWKLPDTRD